MKPPEAGLGLQLSGTAAKASQKKCRWTLADCRGGLYRGVSLCGANTSTSSFFPSQAPG